MDVGDMRGQDELAEAGYEQVVACAYEERGENYEGGGYCVWRLLDVSDILHFPQPI